MQTRYVVVAIVVSFVTGAVTSHYRLQSEVANAKEQTELLVAKMRGLLAARDHYRAMSSLEATVDAVGGVVTHDSRSTPRKYLGEEYRRMLKSRMAQLESLQPNIKDAAAIEKSEQLMKRANELLDTIELSYL